MIAATKATRGIRCGLLLGLLCICGCSSLQKMASLVRENQEAVAASTAAIQENGVAIAETTDAIRANHDAIQESTEAVNQNRQGVSSSTEAIKANEQIVSKSTTAIGENEHASAQQQCCDLGQRAGGSRTARPPSAAIRPRWNPAARRLVRMSRRCVRAPLRSWRMRKG